ncbi:MAG: proline racemase family protein [Tepidisphaeraceae bacterium]
MSNVTRIQIIDSHTGGEPTRVVIAGGPGFGSGSLAERRERFGCEFDTFGSAVVNEPRGSDVIVGALLVPPADPRCVAGVIFFNNVGTLGMCGHGTIGVGVTLGHMGRIKAGTHLLETPVGVVSFTYDGANTVELENVPSCRQAKSVRVHVPDYGEVVGDVAWGGNWFFLVNEHRETLRLQNVERLTEVTWRIRAALEANDITGANGAVIDHIELFGPPGDASNHSRNFVLCPGKAYDRSPCGTGTSAKLACLAADGKLKPGDVWRQESILGSVFEGSFRFIDGQIIPRIRGTAYVTAEATLLLDPNDPFREGIR